MKKIFLVVIGCFSLFPIKIYAELFYWIDKNNVKHYTQEIIENKVIYRLNGEILSGDYKSYDTIGNNDNLLPVSSKDENESLKIDLKRIKAVEYDEELDILEHEIRPYVIKRNNVGVEAYLHVMASKGIGVDLEYLPLQKSNTIKQDTEYLVNMIKTKAETGHPLYKTILAKLYFKGFGLKENIEAALTLLKEATDQNYAGAFWELGNIYIEKNFHGNNVKDAMDYYEKAGEKGFSTAWYYLGVIHRNGMTGKVDYDLAMKYYMKSAYMNNSIAQSQIGYCCLKGKGIKKDIEEAVHWYRLSFSNGNYTAEKELIKIENDLKNKRILKDQKNNSIPRYFRRVDICPPCLKGIYKIIWISDLTNLIDNLTNKPELIKEEDSVGWTPLSLAIAAGSEEITKYLIKNKYSVVNKKNQNNELPPLHIAAFTGQINIVQELLDRGADMNFIYTPPSKYYWYSSLDGTPLHVAFGSRKYDIVSLLLKNGADFKKQNKDSLDLFEYAIDLDKRNIIEEIFKEVGLPVPAA